MYELDWEAQARLEEEEYRNLDEETKLKGLNLLLRDVFRYYED